MIFPSIEMKIRTTQHLLFFFVQLLLEKTTPLSPSPNNPPVSCAHISRVQYPKQNTPHVTHLTPSAPANQIHISQRPYPIVSPANLAKKFPPPPCQTLGPSISCLPRPISGHLSLPLNTTFLQGPEHQQRQRECVIGRAHISALYPPPCTRARTCMDPRRSVCALTSQLPFSRAPRSLARSLGG